jgi:CDP-glucose 4,6-dehydratase
MAHVAGRMTAGATLVTGGSGLIGARLVDALRERGERVVVLDRGRHGDVADEARMARLVAEHEVETIFHLAAQSILDVARAAPVPTFTTNIRGTWAVLEAARLAGVRRVVVAASSRAYGPADGVAHTEDAALNPASPYDASKAAADLIARSYWPAYGLAVATTRCANVYGPGDLTPSRLIPELMAAAVDGRAARIRSDGTPRRDFLYVDDAVAAYLAIADALDRGDGAARGQAFNAGGGRPVSVREVVDTLGRVAGAPLQVGYDGAHAAEPARDDVDITKLRRVCGWEPRVGLEEGLRRTLEWHRARS